MDDNGSSPDRPDRTTVEFTVPEPVDDDPVDELLGSLIERFKDKSVPDLEAIHERTTIRNVVNYWEVDQWLEPGWEVAAEIVQFSGESLADALVFTHPQKSYDIILKPRETFVPTDDIEIYVLDHTSGTRRQLVRTVPTLDTALQHAVFQYTHRQFNPGAPYLLSMTQPLLDGEEMPDDDLTLSE